jgi:RNA-directed DNA polymerase
MHHPIREQGAWLRSVVGGHFRYYGVPTNSRAMSTFRHQVVWIWKRSLQRRSQRRHLTWQRMYIHIKRWLPTVRIHHPYPLKRLGVIT